MKVECVKNKLTGMVHKVERAVGKNNNLPVLGCLLLVAENGRLTISATNLDLGIKGEVSVRVSSEGKVAVPAAVFSGYLSQLPDEGSVVLESVEGNLQVSTKHTKTTIKSFSVDDFPSIPDIKGGISVSLPVADTVKGLAAVWYSAATSSMKPELSSVCVYTDHHEMVFVATDSFRLAEKRLPIKKDIEFHPILIPFKNVGDIIKVFEGYRGDINLSISKSQISLDGDGVYLVSRVIEGTFPDYQQIIPKDFKTEVVLLKQDFLSALKVSTIFSGAFHQISFKALPAKKLFEMRSESGQTGKNATHLDSVVKGEELEANFNHRYLADCFQSIGTDSITLGFNGAHRALVLRGVGDRTFTYLVMPMNN